MATHAHLEQEATELSTNSQKLCYSQLEASHVTQSKCIILKKKMEHVTLKFLTKPSIFRRIKFCKAILTFEDFLEKVPNSTAETM